MSESTFKGLDPSMIEKLMGESRQRNTYGPKLVEFIASDEAGINPAEAWPLEFGKKNASTLYQGFLTAAKKAEVADQIRILQNDGSVFILHKERAGLAVEEANSDEEATEDSNATETGEEVSE
jgi:hypothetical protein